MQAIGDYVQLRWVICLSFDRKPLDDLLEAETKKVRYARNVQRRVYRSGHYNLTSPPLPGMLF